jgi:hypothetical protein
VLNSLFPDLGLQEALCSGLAAGEPAWNISDRLLELAAQPRQFLKARIGSSMRAFMRPGITRLPSPR